MGSEAVARAAAEHGIEGLHFDMRFLKPVDTSALAEACRKAECLITLEDGVTAGGLYSTVAEYIAANGLARKLKGMGIPDRFIEQGTPAQLYAECGFDANGILAEILKEKN